MSQSNRGSGGSRSGSQRPQAARKGGSQSSPRSRPPTQAAVRQSGRGGRRQSPLKSNIDRALPPFTTRRYLAIWAAGMVPLVLVLLLLTQCNNSATNPAQATPIPAATSNTSNAAGLAPLTKAPQPTEQNQPANPSQPTDTPLAASSAVSPTVGGASTGAGGQGKYMIIETTKGRITAKLHTEPEAGVSKTIANFEQKANSKYFDGLTFHRVENWVIQGGDPAGNGTGGGTMPSEYNQISFKAGALGVARGPDPAINNDSQFFVVKSDADYLNGQYTNFGQVLDKDSMNVVNQIAIGDKITSIRVENR